MNDIQEMNEMDMTDDDEQGNKEGWGVFSCWDLNGERGLEIQRLDDPSNLGEGYPTDPVFESDEEALAFVVEQARLGSAYHIHTLFCCIEREIENPQS